MMASEAAEARMSAARALAPVEAAMRRVFESLSGEGPGADDLAQFYGMARYHLGWADLDLAPASADAGKKLRPLLVVRCAEACGGTAAAAAPAAAAIELLHNFTLVHDDIQDQSSHRRHRETVWHHWGLAAAINVGDALFALAHEALYALAEPPANVSADRVLRIARDFDRTALRIVEGQHLDLSHEGEWGGGEGRYLAMIGGKTAAIIDFAARAGATLAGADAETVEQFGAFGLATGLAFQIRDDILGIWAPQSVTGKPMADDLRRRKQSLPVIALDERATLADRAELRRLYAAPPDEAAVAAIVALLDRYEAQDYCQHWVDRYHHEARAILDRLDGRVATTAALREFIGVLEGREY
jgi:geranylgeranyl diphosphate synthase, type I